MRHFLLLSLTAACGLAGSSLTYAQTASDFDDDGITNVNDLDADNDGIPDAVENPCALAPITGTAPLNPAVSSTPATAIYGDFGGYWNSAAGSVNPVRPDGKNQVLALTIGGATYPTGVSNPRMKDADGDGLFDGIDTDGDGDRDVVATETSWLALHPTNDVLGGVRLEPPGADGNPNGADGPTLVVNRFAPSNPYLYFGERGFDMSYGMANIGSDWNFNVSDVDPASVGDAVPDIIVNQIADPGGADEITIYLLDAAGAYLGRGVAVEWDNVDQIGTYQVDQYSSGGSRARNQFKSIRFAGVFLSAFGLSAGEVLEVASMRVVISANADPTFVAVNEASFRAICNPPDADNDGVYDYRDLDSDNDGIADLVEAGGADADGDGRVDAAADADGDGLADVYDNDDDDGPTGSAPDPSGEYAASTSLLLDTDGDGVTDAASYDLDADGIPNYRDADSDGDGIADVVENAGGDRSADAPPAQSLNGRLAAFDDPEAVPDGYDNAARAAATSTDTDGDGVPDYRDLDADNDGILDRFEHAATDADAFGAPGTGDANADGLADEHSQLTDANLAGGANAGVNPHADDEDVTDALPDYLDPDADGDGTPDWAEGFDADGDGRAIDDVTARAQAYATTQVDEATGNEGDYDTALDADADGIPDFADNRPATPGYDVSSRPPYLTVGSAFYFDRNGNGVADLYDPLAVGGEAAPLAQASTSLADRDWRDAGTQAALPVELTGFAVVAAADCDGLRATWTVAGERDVSHYVVERSLDGVIFAAVAEVSARGDRAYAAALPAPAAPVTYYRLASHDLDGSSATFDVVAVGGACTLARVGLAPNPAPPLRSSELATDFDPATEVSVVSATGRHVAAVVTDDAGRLRLPAVAAGLYLLRDARGRAAKLLVR